MTTLGVCTFFFWWYATSLALVPIAILFAVFFEFKLPEGTFKATWETLVLFTIFWALCDLLAKS
jgi:hypothetical protein